MRKQVALVITFGGICESPMKKRHMLFVILRTDLGRSSNNKITR